MNATSSTPASGATLLALWKDAQARFKAAGLDSPSIDEMPYVLKIKQVDNIRFERATFWMPLPPVK